MLDRIKHIEEQLIAEVEAQTSHLDCVDACELGEVINAIHHLEEAKYYHVVTGAMQDPKEYEHEDRRYYNKMKEPYHETDYDIYAEKHHVPYDTREGRSGRVRKTYMESKEKHWSTQEKMRELEKYLQELATDVSEMIEDASPEEKNLMVNKISALAAKINA